jgi:hypothetical protein
LFSFIHSELEAGKSNEIARISVLKEMCLKNETDVQFFFILVEIVMVIIAK